MSNNHRQSQNAPKQKEINVLFEAPPNGMSLIQALETSILEEFRSSVRLKAFTILYNLDRLAVRLKHLSPSNIRHLGGRMAMPDEKVIVDEIAVSARGFFKEANPDEQRLLTGILEHRDITVGPRGRDSLNRSTRALRTSIGKIVFD